MNSKFLFAKIAGLMTLAFGLFVAGELVKKHLDQPPSAQPVATVVQTQQPIAQPVPHPMAIPVKLKKPAPAQNPEPAPPIAPVQSFVDESAAPESGPAPAPSAPVEAPDPIRRRINPNLQTVMFIVRVLPGQELDIDNCCFSYVRIESETPIAVHAGQCQATDTLEANCHIMANVDLAIQDNRIGVPSMSAPINRVRISAIRDDPGN